MTFRKLQPAGTIAASAAPAYLGISRSRFYVYAARPDFPQAVRLSRKAVFYRMADLDAWGAAWLAPASAEEAEA